MSDMLSQAEINALLGNLEKDSAVEEEEGSDPIVLTDEQKDILGEIGNITMGTSATTMFALLGEKVLITTPEVSVTRWESMAKNYKRPCVGIRVDYKEGIEGSNLLVLRQRDVKIISNLMLGVDGETDADADLTEIDLSAIAEAMNQMVGSSSTSLSSLVSMRIDIDTPQAFIMDLNDIDVAKDVTFPDKEIICIKFKMVIGDLIDSDIMQVLPVKFALQMVDILQEGLDLIKAGADKPTESGAPPAEAAAPPQARREAYGQADQTSQTPYGPSQTYYVPPPQNINARPAQFASFDYAEASRQKENIGIIMDVPLEIMVELGRASKKIKDILEFSPGTIIELDKLAGDPIDILVNGKFVACGEVVVIDENFGVRITEIVSAESRI
jgi:flagellar motor switch protein FliN/FliY